MTETAGSGPEPGQPRQGPVDPAELERQKWERIHRENYQDAPFSYRLSQVGGNPEQQEQNATPGGQEERVDAPRPDQLSPDLLGGSDQPGFDTLAGGEQRGPDTIAAADHDARQRQTLADRARGLVEAADRPTQERYDRISGGYRWGEVGPDGRESEAVTYRRHLDQAREGVSELAEEEALRVLRELPHLLLEGEAKNVSVGQGMTEEHLQEVDDYLRWRLGFPRQASQTNTHKIHHPRRADSGQPRRSAKRLATDVLAEPFRWAAESVLKLRDTNGRKFEERISKPDLRLASTGTVDGQGRMSDADLNRLRLVERFDPKTGELRSADMFVLQEPKPVERSRFLRRRLNKPTDMEDLLERRDRVSDISRAEHPDDPADFRAAQLPGEVAAAAVGYVGGPVASADAAAQRAQQRPGLRSERRDAHAADEAARQAAREVAQQARAERPLSDSEYVTRSADNVAEVQRALMDTEQAAERVAAGGAGSGNGGSGPEGPAPAGEAPEVELRPPTAADRAALDAVQKDYNWAMSAAEPHERTRRLGQVAEHLQRNNLATGLGGEEGLAAGGLQLEHSVADAATESFVKEVANQWQESYRVLRAEQLATAARTFAESTGGEEMPERVRGLIDEARRAGVYVENRAVHPDADPLSGRPSGQAARDLSEQLDALVATAAQRAERAGRKALTVEGLPLPANLPELSAQLDGATRGMDPADRLRALRAIAERAVSGGLVRRVPDQNQYQGAPPVGVDPNQMHGIGEPEKARDDFAVRLNHELADTGHPGAFEPPMNLQQLPAALEAARTIEDTGSRLQALRRLAYRASASELIARVPNQGVQYRAAVPPGVDGSTMHPMSPNEKTASELAARLSEELFEASRQRAREGHERDVTAEEFVQIVPSTGDPDAPGEAYQYRPNEVLLSELEGRITKGEPDRVDKETQKWRMSKANGTEAGAMSADEARLMVRYAKTSDELQQLQQAVRLRDGYKSEIVNRERQDRELTDREREADAIFAERGVELRLTEAGSATDREQGRQLVQQGLQDAMTAGYVEAGGPATEIGEFRPAEGKKQEGHRILRAARRATHQLEGASKEALADEDLFNTLEDRARERNEDWEVPEGELRAETVQRLARQEAHRDRLSQLREAVARRAGIPIEEVEGRQEVRPRDDVDGSLMREIDERDLELQVIEPRRTRDLGQQANRKRAEQQLKEALAAVAAGYLESSVAEPSGYGDYSAIQVTSTDEPARSEEQRRKREGERLLARAAETAAIISGGKPTAQAKGGQAETPGAPAAPAGQSRGDAAREEARRVFAERERSAAGLPAGGGPAESDNGGGEGDGDSGPKPNGGGVDGPSVVPSPDALRGGSALAPAGPEPGPEPGGGVPAAPAAPAPGPDESQGGPAPVGPEPAPSPGPAPVAGAVDTAGAESGGDGGAEYSVRDMAPGDPRTDFSQLVDRVRRDRPEFTVQRTGELSPEDVAPLLEKVRTIAQFNKLMEEMRQRGSFVELRTDPGAPSRLGPRPGHPQDEQLLRMIDQRERALRVQMAEARGRSKQRKR